VTLQTLTYQVNSTSDISRLVINGIPDPIVLGKNLHELGLSLQIAIIPDGTDDKAEEIESSAVFIGDEARREYYVARGYKPNLIFSYQELRQFVLI